ncbi:sensor histidine kinase [Qiania dongpingensis]|uniref:histidine kinase n=1 Tax=Qiania dongpingensis TaxID=2763669 RepID=A0A7G9G6W4_9FIRM|nr:HAMP domain-containing sensor histidine kinase [Qiania dongpingensis]QNM06546.1 HAMP domain-containing histidine kinase [Qiania dongpingensis]
MFRNREVKYGFWVLLAAGVLAGSAIFAESGEGFRYFLLFLLVSVIVYLLVNHIRYRKISGLSLYLKKVLNGDKKLDIPDNAEGELSLLRNDIYKMVTRLETQAELLSEDKAYLAGSLSDISHQLKTPMTSMMVMTDILRDESLPAEKREEFIDSIRSQLKRMEWLLSSLLKMSKLDAGAIQFKQEPVQVSELVRKAVEHLLIPMELKNQTLAVEIPESQYIGCDVAWTSEAISNIVKNCMEHTPENGKITIYSEERGVYLQLVVEDSGEGIAPEDLPHIFERFYKGKNAGRDSVGIGLAMAKYILNIQNGQVEVESTPGAGSRFFIRLYRKVI